jgi:hypothetical protein
MKRFNLFDAAVAAFVIVLIPIAYGTYLLFRAPKTIVTSVKRVEIAKEERRVGGPNLVAKFKVTGSGLRPLLRASIDDEPAIGLVFENPNSADLLVGSVTPGAHDLVLYDGRQEIARAPKSIVVEQAMLPRSATVHVRLNGPVEVTSLVTIGDRDFPYDAGAATVVDVGKDGVTLRLLADAAESGWQYHGLVLKPGLELTVTTAHYIVKGTVLTMAVQGS